MATNRLLWQPELVVEHGMGRVGSSDWVLYAVYHAMLPALAIMLYTVHNVQNSIKRPRRVTASYIARSR